MILGRKSEIEYRGPATPMSMSMPVYVFQSLNAATTYFHWNSSTRADACPSLRKREMTTYFSNGSRNVASSGKSTSIQIEMTPITTLKIPSKMNYNQNIVSRRKLTIHDQPANPATPLRFAIAAAKRPPNAPLSAAAEKNRAARNPSSLRLYQHDK